MSSAQSELYVQKIRDYSTKLLEFFDSVFFDIGRFNVKKIIKNILFEMQEFRGLSNQIGKTG